MNIYRIRDRLINHWSPVPFFAPNDGEAMAALSISVNSGDSTNAFAQAPHHFELWKIGSVQNQGETNFHQITALEPTFVCDLSALIREAVRTHHANARRLNESEQTNNRTPTMENQPRQSGGTLNNSK